MLEKLKKVLEEGKSARVAELSDEEREMMDELFPVSYTHLDVYKRKGVWVTA